MKSTPAIAPPIIGGIVTEPPTCTAATFRHAIGIGQGEASRTVAGLSSPGKMPCPSYGLPAAECNVGSKLRASHTEAHPTVCGGCYALKGSYQMYPEVIPAQYRRLGTVRSALANPDDRDRWTLAMVALIAWECRTSHVFRWHDSGDLQSVDHLALIAEVCERTPWVRHWIPTREAKVVATYIREVGPLPTNLNVRQSAALVDHFPNPERARDGRTFSAVAAAKSVPDSAHACPAYRQGGECGSCRACWDPTVPVVVYPLH